MVRYRPGGIAYLTESDSDVEKEKSSAVPSRAEKISKDDVPKASCPAAHRTVQYHPGAITYLSDSDAEAKLVASDLAPAAKAPKNYSLRTPRSSKSQSPAAARSSERIRVRQNRSFRKPSRRDVFDQIETVRSPSKLLSSLKPRQLVNNFMRETHRYNYDPQYTSGESSIEDFIVDDEDDMTSASSSSEEIGTSDRQKTSVRSKKSTETNDDEGEMEAQVTKSEVKKTKVVKTNVKKTKVADRHGSDDGSEEESLNLSSKSRAMISSDLDSPDSDAIVPGSHRKRRRESAKPRNGTKCSSDEDAETAAPPKRSERRLKLFSKTAEESNEESDEEIGEDGDNDDAERYEDTEGRGSDGHSPRSGGKHRSPRAALMEHRRDVKRRMFTELMRGRRRSTDLSRTGN